MTMDNLLLLCCHHHRLVHEGGYHVDRNGWFYDRRGSIFPAVPPLPRGRPAASPDRHRLLRIDADTCEPGTGDPTNLGDAVDALLSAARVPSLA